MTAAEIQMRKNGNNIFMGINNIAGAKAGTEPGSGVDSETEAVAYLEADRKRERGNSFVLLFFTPFSCEFSQRDAPKDEEEDRRQVPLANRTH